MRHSGPRLCLIGLFGISLVLLLAPSPIIGPTIQAQDSQINISPIGGKLAYVARDGNLYVLDGTTGVQTLVASAGPEPINEVAWAPDGAAIAYVSAAPQDNIVHPQEDFHIHVVDSSGSAPRTVVQRRDLIGSLRWFPDSHRLLYSAAVIRPRLYVVRTDDFQNAPLSKDRSRPEGQHDAAISPDGVQVAFFDSLTDANGAISFGIMLADVFHATERVLLDLGPGFRIRSLAWSPDSSIIAFADEHGIHEVEVATGQDRLVIGLSTNVVGILRIGYSPDGSTLAVDYLRALTSAFSHWMTTVRRDGTLLATEEIDAHGGWCCWASDSAHLLLMSSQSDVRMSLQLADSNLGNKRLLGDITGPFDWHR